MNTEGQGSCLRVDMKNQPHKFQCKYTTIQKLEIGFQ